MRNTQIYTIICIITLISMSKSAPDLPETFDPVWGDLPESKSLWKSCLPPIRDQQACGGCYAFAVTTALSHRICISTNGKYSPLLSVHELIACDQYNSGCEGGTLLDALVYLEAYGVTEESCYSFGSCSFNHCNCRKNLLCMDKSIKFNKYWCKKGSQMEFRVELNTWLKWQIYEKGGVSVGFESHEDFSQYPNGYDWIDDVYSLKGPYTPSLHGVVILGWGVSPTGIQYWIIHNSWSTNWGFGGYGKVAFGEVLMGQIEWAYCDSDV